MSEFQKHLPHFQNQKKPFTKNDSKTWFNQQRAVHVFSPEDTLLPDEDFTVGETVRENIFDSLQLIEGELSFNESYAPLEEEVSCDLFSRIESYGEEDSYDINIDEFDEKEDLFLPR